MAKKKHNKPLVLRVRNRLAISAWNRSGAGSHGDRRKETARRACRGKVLDTAVTDVA